MTSNGNIPITARQLQLVACIASGLTIDQAARRCHMASQSAYNTLSSARASAGTKTVTQLVVLSVIKDWIVAVETESGIQFVPSDPALRLPA